MRQTQRGVAEGDRHTDTGKETEKKWQRVQEEGRVRGRGGQGEGQRREGEAGD